jgi:putative PEP-CTERM system histidine kinase
MLAARGAVNALVVPLIAVSAARNREWSVDVFVSRGAVFHTATLLGAGLYMLLMAAVGYYLRGYGGAWGPLLQTSFLFVALALLVVVLSSGRVRSGLRVFVSKHFFNYKYDYREEWLRFTGTISDAGRDAELRDRAIRAVADLVDSPDGGLWLRDDRGNLVHAATWNQAWPSEEIPVDSPFGQLLGESQWVIHLDRAGALPPSCSHDAIPTWMLESQRAWLAVPLIHDARLLGFMLLGRPRAPRELNWEDYDLLKTVGRQAASYLALEQTTRALIESRQFESFNRRFAFVLHDIKNLVSQLSLMVRNADRYGKDPAFQDDMLETVRESVDKMNRLLARLHSGQEGHTTLVRLDDLLRAVVATKAEVAFECDDPEIAVAVDADRLTAVVEHLVQNGLDANSAGSAVRVRLRSEPGHAIIEIEDDGPGMDARFVRDELFRPFRTTKGEGYGIGAYESREFAREMGGWLDVDSEPGRGTVMRLVLPTIAGEAAPDADGRKVSA